MTDSLLGLTLLFSLGYIILIGIFTAGWYRLKSFTVQDVARGPSVSIIVAVRNEARRIGLLIGDLLKQEASFELIIVDDHSDDGTPDVIRRILEKHPGIPFRLLKQMEGQAGKKAAINAGIRGSRGELIITTDGDCRVGPLWVASLASFYARYHHKFISGPVCYENKKGFFAAFSSLEFLSLVGAGAGAIGAGIPIMCNGANLAFEKSVYLAMAANMQGSDYASGDDVFLMHEIKGVYGSQSIGFVKNPGAIVVTEPPRSLPAFIHQRLRWVSKSRGYSDPATITTSLVIFVFHLFLLVFLVAGCFHPVFLTPFFIMLGIKLLADIPILNAVTGFMSQKKLLWYYLPVQAMYIPFVVLSGLAGNLRGYSWKGRKKRRKEA